MAGLHVNLVAGNGYLVLELAGELDLATVGPTRERFGAIAGSLPDVLIVDCAGVTFLDSSALGLFAVMNRTVSERDGVFVLVNVDRQVGRPLEITGLDRVLRVHWADEASPVPVQMPPDMPGQLSASID